MNRFSIFFCSDQNLRQKDEREKFPTLAQQPTVCPGPTWPGFDSRKVKRNQIRHRLFVLHEMKLPMTGSPDSLGQ